LLLAAVAMPAAALSSSGWVLQRMGLASTQQSSPAIAGKPSTHRASRPLSAPTLMAQPPSPAPEGAAEPSSSDLVRPVPTLERAQQKLGRVQSKPERVHVESKPVQSDSEHVQAEPEAMHATDAPLVSTAPAAPAIIEPIEAPIAGAPKGSATSARLVRSAGMNRSGLRSAVVSDASHGVANRDRPSVPKGAPLEGEHGNAGMSDPRDRSQRHERGRDRSGR
jgi:hypothetical protein